MANKTYKWKDSTRSKRFDPQKVGTYLEKLRERHGGMLTPDMVVRAATRSDSPIHDWFEWNDTRAAREHRKQQARVMLNHLVIIRPDQPEDEPPRYIRAFVIVSTEEEKAYTSIFAAMRDGILRKQVLSRALREAEQWQTRYNDYEELAAVFDAIDTVKQNQQLVVTA